MDIEQVRRAARAIASAEAVLIGAGAGIGVDSGLPDFRGSEGFWRAYPPMKQRGIRFEQMANPQWFHTEPRLAWGFYGHRMHLYRDAHPHAGFGLLSQMIGERPHAVYTSNVDGQFQKAGFDPAAVFEIHGSLHWLQEVGGVSGKVWSADSVNVAVDESTFLAKPPLPRAPSGQLARPNVLMFGDGEFAPTRVTEQARRYRQWLLAHAKARIAVIEIGAGTAIPSVRMECEQRGEQGTLIRINPRESFGPHGTMSFATGALAALSAIASELGIKADDGPAQRGL